MACQATASDGQKASEKRKVDSSILSLTTTSCCALVKVMTCTNDKICWVVDLWAWLSDFSRSTQMCRVLAHRPLGHLFRPRAGRAAGAIRGAAACRDGRRPPVLRPRGQRRGDLAHRAAAARPPAPRPPLPARILGTRRGGNPAPRPPALAAAVAARGGLSP